MAEPIRQYTEDTIARLAADVRAMESKYGMASSEMLASVSKRPSSATREISAWLTSYQALRLLRGDVPATGTLTTTTA